LSRDEVFILDEFKYQLGAIVAAEVDLSNITGWHAYYAMIQIPVKYDYDLYSAIPVWATASQIVYEHNYIFKGQHGKYQQANLDETNDIYTFGEVNIITPVDNIIKGECVIYLVLNGHGVLNDWGGWHSLTGRVAAKQNIPALAIQKQQIADNYKTVPCCYNNEIIRDRKPMIKGTFTRVPGCVYRQQPEYIEDTY